MIAVPSRFTAPPLVAMVGGGQLARMTHQAAIALGQTLRVLAADAGRSRRAGTPDVVIGSHTDLEDLRRVAAGADVLTFDHEHVPTELLDKLVAEGVNVAPPPQALVHAQDKLVMRRRLEALGAPVPRYAAVDAPSRTSTRSPARVGGPVVIKAVRGGYDGRGVRMADEPARGPEIAGRYLAAGVPVLVEERVDDAPRALRAGGAVAVRAGRGVAGGRDGAARRHLRQVIAPAPELPDALGAASAAAGACGWRPSWAWSACWLSSCSRPLDGELLVNELAMRPHNSGHWTMDGARTSQFEQHLRAVLDYPLGDTDAVAPVTVMANVLGARAAAGDEPRRAVAPPVRADARGASTSTAKPSGRAARSGTSTSLGTDAGMTLAQICANGPTGRHTGCHTGSGRTDGTRMAQLADAPRVGVIMGSDSDWSVMKDAAEALAEFDVPYEVGVVSAHRTPGLMFDYAREAADRGLQVIIAGAGGAAHLPGMVAAATPLPVIGVPVPLARLDGLDSLLSIVQMPAGVPVATVSIGGAPQRRPVGGAHPRC